MGGRHGTAGRCDDRLLPPLSAQGHLSGLLPSHSDSAFGLSCVLGSAQLGAAAGDRALQEAIVAQSLTCFGRHSLFRREPSRHEFLSPALTEAELGQILLLG